MQARRLSETQNTFKREGVWRKALAAAILTLALTAPGWSAEASARGRAAQGAAPESFISIQFADRSIPDIHVSGVDKPAPYGTYLSPEEQRAQDVVAATTPPPDPRYYRLDWESHDAFDYARVQAIQGFLFDQGYWYGGRAWDYEYPLMRRLGIWHSLSPTHPTPLPQYNLLEYRADLAAWRRARERAALNGVTGAPERSR